MFFVEWFAGKKVLFYFVRQRYLVDFDYLEKLLHIGFFRFVEFGYKHFELLVGKMLALFLEFECFGCL
jgi:hypothetical protein